MSTPVFQEGDTLLENVSLSTYTSWQVGGPARHLFKPKSLESLAAFLKKTPKEEPILMMGLGSNLLVRDGGFSGTVIVLQGALRRLEQTDETTIFSEAGVSCGQLARLSARLGLRRLEFMAGIPGTVGGALAMNAGCHGNETWNQVHSVRVMTRDGSLIDREKSDYQVSYRHVEGPANEWFVGASFFGTPGLKEEAMLEINELLERRHQTQPTNQPSCGSVFRNPPGQAAAQLIESCGLKGFSIGGAMVSPKHANFIVNTGSATAADIEQLIAHIKKSVFEKKSVLLIEEVRIVGVSY